MRLPPSLLRIAGALAAAVLTLAAAANDPRERLPDPAQEARARHLFQQIRCMVCQNETIDDSEADLAGDLRRIVRGQIRAGRSDAEVLGFLRARYGDFVLMRPAVSAANLVLWGLPFAVVVAGGVLMLYRRRHTPEAAPLTPDERAELAALERAEGP